MAASKVANTAKPESPEYLGKIDGSVPAYGAASVELPLAVDSVTASPKRPQLLIQLNCKPSVQMTFRQSCVRGGMPRLAARVPEA